MLSSQAYADPGVGGQQVGHACLIDGGDDLLRGGLSPVHLGGDINDALPVLSKDAGEATPKIHGGDGAKGNLRAIGGANAHSFQVADGAPLRFGVANHHPHVIHAALNPLNF